MNNAQLYKSFSDAKTIVPIQENKTIYENFNGMNFADKIILVNGKKKNADYKVQKNDIVVIRYVPGDTRGLGTGWRVFLGIVSLGITEIVNIGLNAYDAKAAAKKAQEDMEKLKSQMSDSVSNLPYLKGSSNSVATGKTQPYFIGERLLTPYLMNSGGGYKGYSQVSGTDGVDQFIIAVLEMGFNKQVLRKMFCDDVTLKTWDVNTTVPQEGITNFDNTSLFYDIENIIEVAQDGLGFATDSFNKKIVQNTVNTTLKKANEEDYEDLVYTLSQYTKSVDVAILFNGLVAYNDDGNKITRGVTVIPSYSLDNGTTWTNFTFNQNGTPSNTFSRSTLKQLRFNAHFDFSYNAVKDLTDPIQVKVRCTSNKYDGSAQDGVTVLWVQSEIYNPDESTTANNFVAEKILSPKTAANSTLIGLKIKATTANEDKLSKISVISSGVARTWNGTTWSDTKVPTSNVAAWCLEVLTSATHKPSQCDDTEIDLDSFGEWYEYCDTNNIKVDQVLTSGVTKQNVLENIVTTGNAVLYMNVYGKIAVAYDDVKQNAIAVLNEQNLISFDYEKDISKRTDGLNVTFYNKEEDFAEDSYLVYREGVDESSTENTYREITLDNIVNFEQVVKYARRTMAIDELRPKAVTAKIGEEGLYFTPFSKVLVQHASLKVGLGSAEIKSVIYNLDQSQIIGLELYEPIEYDSTNQNGYGVVIQCVGVSYCTQLSRAYTASVNGRVTEIAFSTPISASETIIPKVGEVLSYGYLSSGAFTTITSPFLVSGITPTDKGYTLTLVDYNTAIYDSGTIPTYTPNITQPSTPASEKPPTTQTVSPDELNDAIGKINTGTAVISAPSVPVITAIAKQDEISLTCSSFGLGLSNAIDTITWQYRKVSTDEWQTFSTSAELSTSYFFNRTNDGYPEYTDLTTWQFRAKATNLNNISSEFSNPINVNTDSYGTWIIPNPEVNTRVSDRTITLTMTVDNTSTRKPYGNIRYQVQVKRYDDTDYFKPATNENPYAEYNQAGEVTAGNEQNYKSANQEAPLYAISNGTYVQTMPLQNQSTEAIIDTQYNFKIIAFNEADESEAVVINATALCTNLRDIVKAYETAKAAYVEDLSAISANIGEISDGRLGGENENYWCLSTIDNNDNTTDKKKTKGAFRVGGAEQYFKCVPVITGSTITGYDIDFKVGNFVVSSTVAQSEFVDGIIITDSNYANRRLKLTAEGINAQEYTNNMWNDIGVFALDEFGNLLISNSNEHPTSGVQLPTAGVVYHLQTNALDEDGANPQTITVDGSFVDSETPVGSKAFDGTITIPAAEKDICLLTKSEEVEIKKQFLKYDGTVDTTTTSYVDTCNANASTDWGLTQTQIDGNIFKVVY